ncbi:TetR/AcrR family transcriptional regulator [Streptomyces catenulae]|uniref:TetR/AcrR family transcriptional regulator n=1 Tax=Streptomyces catenulae TaxID=66875 RepID=A0ABV2Z843_9ACTN|nr:TetR/AcrR family transcriptional regulator [Streptomyces catenulae]
MRDEKREAGRRDAVGGCRECGGPLAVGGRGRPARYCSRSCQARAYRRRRQPPVPAPAAEPEPVAVSPRRRQIAEAVWRIAAARGLHAASMREIAAEAGVSLRTVQYHFTGKHQLLVDALRLLHDDNERRARARIRHDADDPRGLLRAVLEEFLPLDEERRTALRVLAAYYSRSLTDPALAAVFLAPEHPLEELVAGLLERARERGRCAPGVDPRHEADLLVSGVTGLGGDLLHGRRPREDVLRVLGYHLDRILPPEADPAGAAAARPTGRTRAS